MRASLGRQYYAMHMQDVEPEEDYILVIDADMIMRAPFIPERLGVRPGWAISAYFGYLKGVSNELALRHVPHVLPRNDTKAGPVGRRGDQVCAHAEGCVLFWACVRLLPWTDCIRCLKMDVSESL